jgi:hypothetical protein
MTQHLFSEELNPFFKAPAASGGKLARRSLGVDGSIKNNLIMQNKPNFQNTQMNATSYPTTSYKSLPAIALEAGKPKQTQFKAIFDLSATYQSQNKPNPTPNKPNSCGLRHSFTQCGLRHPKPPAEFRNSARQKNIKRTYQIKTKPLKLDKQKLPQREKEMSLNKNTSGERKDANPIPPTRQACGRTDAVILSALHRRRNRTDIFFRRRVGMRRGFFPVRQRPRPARAKLIWAGESWLSFRRLS